MTVPLTVCAVWVGWGGNAAVHVNPSAVRVFGEFVHSGAHITGV
jgi:hypothetical protein